MVLKIIFWVSTFVIFYAYIGYPFVLYIWSLLCAKEVRKSYIYPKISIVIAALNEEKYIGRRIEDLLNQDYPEERMEIITVSDGSADKTEEIVESFQNRNVRLFSLKKREGKANALNVAVSKAKGEIIVFTDARQNFKNDAIKQLVANFNDPVIGAVSGELFLTPNYEGNLNKSMGIYWEYEKWVRKKESQIGSVIGVTGAIYAIRRNLYEPIPPDTILDDVLIPMRITLSGFRVILDGTAQAFDDMIFKSEKELKRKVRTLMGNFQLIALLPEALSVSRNKLFINYVSHKLIRLLVPYFLLITLILNLFMLKGIYRLTISVQILFYSAALIGYLFSGKNITVKCFTLPYTFVVLNYAAVLGFLHFIRKNKTIWAKN